MTPRLARSNDEAYLYMAAAPCPTCGNVGVGDVVEATVGTVDGVKTRTYVAPCLSCGTRREFTFQVPDTPLQPIPGHLRFGSDRPSELLDPGEWLTLADTMMAGVPDDVAGVTDADRARLRSDLDVARAALEEVLKFIPAGRDAVPRHSFWTEAGHRLSLHDRWRFSRERLVEQRTESERLLALLGG